MHRIWGNYTYIMYVYVVDASRIDMYRDIHKYDSNRKTILDFSINFVNVCIGIITVSRKYYI